MNEDKTQNIIFSLKSNSIPHKESLEKCVKFLGVFIDNQLTWEAHINYISTRLSRVLFLLRRLIHNVPQEYIKTAYFAYFQSVMRYGLILWGNSSKIENILILQKKAGF